MYNKEKCKEEITFRLDPKRIVRMAEISVFQKEKITLMKTRGYENV